MLRLHILIVVSVLGTILPPAPVNNRVDDAPGSRVDAFQGLFFEIEKGIAAQTGDPLVVTQESIVAAIRRAPTYESFIAASARSEFWQMVGSRADYINLAGYLGLLDLNDPDVLLAASATVIHSDSLLVLDIVQMSLGDALGSQQLLDAIVRVSRLQPKVDHYSPCTFVQLAGLGMNGRVMDEWFHRDDRPSVQAPLETIIVSSAISNRLRSNEPISEQLEAAINRYRQLPGHPRLAYILHASKDAPEYKSVLEHAIEEEEWDELDVVLLLIHEYLHTTIDELKISEANARRIRELLSLE